MIADRLSPSKVFYVSHVGELGGAERSLLDLIAGLNRQVYRPVVVLPNEGPLSARLRRLDVELLFCPMLQSLRRPDSLLDKAGLAMRLLAGGCAIAALIRRHSPAIVHANSTTAALFVHCLPGRRRPPTLWHLRDLVLPRRAARFLARRSNVILVPSTCCGELIRSRTECGRVVEIANGVTPPVAAAAVRPRTAAPGEPVLIAMVAQLAAWKGHDAAIDIAHRVISRRSNASFLIVADDRLRPQPEVLRRLKAKVGRLGLGGRVAIEPGTEDVAAILAKADILLHPAFPEPFGRILVEAMASGCPVVAYGGQHGPTQIVRDGVDGLLAPPGSTDALAEGIIALIDDPLLRRRMTESGVARAGERYGRSGMARRVEHVYQCLLARPLHDAFGGGGSGAARPSEEEERQGSKKDRQVAP